MIYCLMMIDLMKVIKYSMQWSSNITSHFPSLDIDECAIKTDSCGVYEICNNTEGSFNCSCKDRSEGNNSIGNLNILNYLFCHVQTTNHFSSQTPINHDEQIRMWKSNLLSVYRDSCLERGTCFSHISSSACLNSLSLLFSSVRTKRADFFKIIV